MESLPDGSEIKIETERGFGKIVIPPYGGGFWRVIAAVFILVWLAAWAGAMVSAVQALTGGFGDQAGDSTMATFNYTWLITGTLGGIIAIQYALTLFRPGLPEVFLLTTAGMTYDSGRSQAKPTNVDHGTGITLWKRMTQRRIQTKFTEKEMRTLQLRDSSSGHRLTIDRDGKQIWLAFNLSDDELEWLRRQLVKKYNLKSG